MADDDETLLITGGTGFVMSHLARHWLESAPDSRVLIYDSAPSDAAVERFFAPVASRLDVVRGDVMDLPALEAATAGRRITRVVHGAAVTSINRHLGDVAGNRPRLAGARPALEANILGTLNLLDWAVRQVGLRRFIYVSSGAVYGGEGPAEVGAPLPEEGYVAPEGLYDISKYSAELLTLHAARGFGLPAVSVRFSGVYGPMDRETPARDVKCVPYRMAHLALAGQTLRVNSLSAVGDFIHAHDVAVALGHLLRAERPVHPVYNVAYGAATSLATLLDIVAEKLPDTAFEVVSDAKADVRLDPALTGGRWGAYDISRLAEEFGWRPRPIRDAFHDYIDWLSANPSQP
jgi:nucleoside-diphosphate-sugar epimerase